MITHYIHIYNQIDLSHNHDISATTSSLLSLPKTTHHSLLYFQQWYQYLTPLPKALSEKWAYWWILHRARYPSIQEKKLKIAWRVLEKTTLYKREIRAVRFGSWNPEWWSNSRNRSQTNVNTNWKHKVRLHKCDWHRCELSLG